jgi:hypothetical protein
MANRPASISGHSPSTTTRAASADDPGRRAALRARSCVRAIASSLLEAAR